MTQTTSLPTRAALVSITLAFAAVAFAAVVGCSSSPDGSDERSATSEDSLTGGAYVASDRTPALEILGGCSAVKVGIRHVLTAGHCVYGQFNSSTGKYMANAAYADGAPISVTSRHQATVPGAWFATTIMHTYVFDAFRTQCTNDCSPGVQTSAPYAPDLAVIVLNDDFPSTFGPAAELSSGGPGTWVFKTGYGCENGQYGGAPNPPSLKSQLTQAITPDLNSVADNTAFGVDYLVTPGLAGGGAASLCPGDSGGGDFSGPFNYGGKLVAINAGGIYGDPRGWTTRDFHTRMDAPGVTSWIKLIIEPVNGTAGPGVDPGTGADYCNDAAIMCSIVRLPEYLTLAHKCELYGGQVPACAFPDVATVCMEASMACAQHASNTAVLVSQCTSLGGAAPCRVQIRFPSL